MPVKTKIEQADLGVAYAGSWYTIAGCGGDLNEWVVGVEKMLRDHGVGKPTGWFKTTGTKVNDFAFPDGWLSRWEDCFQGDLTFLMFPLDGLDVPKLVPLKFEMQDRWFDDVIDNMRRRKWTP